ncbi:MAG: hypothetical protein ACTSV6_04265 [Candidatus Heimdallarchaeota archaeon]
MFAKKVIKMNNYWRKVSRIQTGICRLIRPLAVPTEFFKVLWGKCDGGGGTAK